MPRYIDADALIKKVFPYDLLDKKCYSIGAKVLHDAIAKAPTADVVPREEVNRLRSILNDYALQYGTVKDQKAVIERIKADTAKTIFAEIESLAMSKLDAGLSVAQLDDTYYIQAIDDLKDKYIVAPPPRKPREP